jgi:hypothetical protein
MEETFFTVPVLGRLLAECLCIVDVLPVRLPPPLAERVNKTPFRKCKEEPPCADCILFLKNGETQLCFRCGVEVDVRLFTRRLPPPPLLLPL